MKRRKKPDPKAIHSSPRMFDSKKKNKKPKYTPQEIKSFQQTALELYKADEGHAVELGRALLKVRAAMKHGEFKPWWKKNNLSQARVSYCMRLAQNKVAAAKAKRNAAKYVQATQFLTKKLNVLFRSCAGPLDSLTMPSIQKELRETVGATFAQAAALAGWKLDTPEVKRAADNLNNAIEGLVFAMTAPQDATLLPPKKAIATATA